MTTKDALLEAARLARGRAEYFEARAGRRKNAIAPALREPHERAAAERKALAFTHAAAVIEQVAAEGRWP